MQYILFLQPPRLCSFQSSSYVLSYTDGNETWSNEPVVIIDARQLIREKIESGIKTNKDYNVTVTVFTGSANLSSSASIGT